MAQLSQHNTWYMFIPAFIPFNRASFEFARVLSGNRRDSFFHENTGSHFCSNAQWLTLENPKFDQELEKHVSHLKHMFKQERLVFLLP